MKSTGNIRTGNPQVIPGQEIYGNIKTANLQAISAQ
jgi:hypothetical protein